MRRSAARRCRRARTRANERRDVLRRVVLPEAGSQPPGSEFEPRLPGRSGEHEGCAMLVGLRVRLQVRGHAARSDHEQDRRCTSAGWLTASVRAPKIEPVRWVVAASMALLVALVPFGARAAERSF